MTTTRIRKHLLYETNNEDATTTRMRYDNKDTMRYNNKDTTTHYHYDNEDTTTTRT
jgi:hypothetical protein